MTQVEETSARSPLPVAVRKATKADESRLVAAMARAFDDDPIANWFAVQDKHRARRVYDFMKVAVHRLTMPFGEVYTTDEIQGGACWNPPGTWKMGPLQQLMMTPAMISVCSFKRLPGVMKGLNTIEKDHPAKPHWYLLALGVEPDLQGRGIGSQLMQPVLERCDREGVPAYLESSKERNVPLYERHGFKVTKEMMVPSNGPKVWLMWRDPQ